MRFNQAQRGSILIAVLWSLFFLATLAVAIHMTIAPQLDLAARLRDRVVLRYLAQAGIQRAALEVQLDETTDFDAANEPWSRNEEAFREIELADGEYFTIAHPVEIDADENAMLYGMIDEESKININAAPMEVLKRFFEIVVEASSQEATDMADAVVDWRDPDEEPSENGAESPYYEGLDEGYPCKDGNFEVLEELLLVKGVTPEIFDRVKSYLTIFGSGQVNINTADGKVLQSLGLSEELAQKIVEYRAGGDGETGSEDDTAFEGAGSIAAVLGERGALIPEDNQALEELIATGFLGVQSQNFQGEAIGGFRDRAGVVKIIFVIHRNGQVRYWRES